MLVIQLTYEDLLAVSILNDFYMINVFRIVLVGVLIKY